MSNPNAYQLCEDKQKNKAHPHYGILFSKKKKYILIHATTRMNFKNIMLSEVRHERPHMYNTQISSKGKDMD